MRRLALVTVLALLAGGCGDDATAPGAGAVGTYDVTAVNGNPIPSVFYADATERIEVAGGAATLSSDGTFQESVILRTTQLGASEPVTSTENYSGTWERVGDGWVLTATGRTYENVTLEGDVLTYTVAGDRGYRLTLERR
jgi:hypothetical protein